MPMPSVDRVNTRIYAKYSKQIQGGKTHSMEKASPLRLSGRISEVIARPYNVM
jgi:hypothetical protein